MIEHENARMGAIPKRKLESKIVIEYHSCKLGQVHLKIDQEWDKRSGQRVVFVMKGLQTCSVHIGEYVKDSKGWKHPVLKFYSRLNPWLLLVVVGMWETLGLCQLSKTHLKKVQRRTCAKSHFDEVARFQKRGYNVYQEAAEY